MMVKLLVTLLLVTVIVRPAWAEAWVIEPVNVVDLASGEIYTGQSVTVENGLIKAVEPAAGGHDEQTRFIDGNNGWLIPGLAEMHAHVPPRSVGEQNVRDVLSLFLANGITTIRGMLGEPWHLELREMLETGEWDGPRLITSGPSFNGESVHAPAQGAAMVTTQARAGYDFLKIHPGLKRDEFIAVAQAAKQAGIPFAGHISTQTSLETALKYGQATIDHLDGYAAAMIPANSDFTGVTSRWFGVNLGEGLDLSLIPGLARETARAGVWNVPTQSLLETMAGTDSLETLFSRPGMNMLSDKRAQSWRSAVRRTRSGSAPASREQLLVARRKLIASLQEQGAGLLLGSDAPQIMNVPGFSAHQELEYMVGAGLTPLQALRSGTVSVAAFFNFPDQGAVAAGMVADFVLLGANPLLDIENTTAIQGVARAGRWHDRETLDAMLDGVRSRGL